jgi:hypothetical protein
MKKLIFSALFAVLSLFTQQAQAQTQDTIWTFSRNGLFFQGRFTISPEGIETTTVTPIGTAAQAAATFKTSVLAETNRLKNDANIIIGYRNVITSLNIFVEAANTTIGVLLHDSLYGNINLFDREWLLNGEGISFRRTEFGALEWRTELTGVWNAGHYLGGILRLKEFYGHTTDFYLGDNEQLRSLDLKYIIEPMPLGSRRIKPAPAAPVSNTETVTLMDGGKVKTALGIFRYNVKTKKWQKE